MFRFCEHLLSMILNQKALHSYISSHKEVKYFIVLALVLFKCFDHLSSEQKQKQTHIHTKKIKRVTIRPYSFKDLFNIRDHSQFWPLMTFGQAVTINVVLVIYYQDTGHLVLPEHQAGSGFSVSHVTVLVVSV